jgi:hypothetical protein
VVLVALVLLLVEGIGLVGDGGCCYSAVVVVALVLPLFAEGISLIGDGVLLL